MQKENSPRRGRDFLIGFIPTLIISLISIFLLFKSEDLTILGTLLIIATVLFLIAIITIIIHRAFIGLGILTVLAATPLLLIGSCFAFTF